MKCLDYVKYIASVLPQSGLVVASITDNTAACMKAGLVNRSFLNLNLGLAIPVGLGLAVTLPKRRVVILDGDGSLLFGSSALPDLASQAPGNVVVVVSDNESYHGVFPSHTSKATDLEAMAKAAGIRNSFTVRNIDEFKSVLDGILEQQQLSFIVAKTEKGRDDEPIRGVEPLHYMENKLNFVRHIERTENVRIIGGYTRSTIIE